jgi:hypothetical protein
LKNKKGFIFTLDVAIALVIVFATILVSFLLVTYSNKDPLPHLQLLKYGSDVARILEYKGYLNSPNPTQIQNELQKILPSYYGMQLLGEGPGDCAFNAGESPPQNKPIIAGERYFNSGGNFCILKYKIWLK